MLGKKASKLKIPLVFKIVKLVLLQGSGGTCCCCRIRMVWLARWGTWVMRALMDFINIITSLPPPDEDDSY